MVYVLGYVSWVPVIHHQGISGKHQDLSVHLRVAVLQRCCVPTDLTVLRAVRLPIMNCKATGHEKCRNIGLFTACVKTLKSVVSSEFVERL